MSHIIRLGCNQRLQAMRCTRSVVCALGISLLAAALTAPAAHAQSTDFTGATDSNWHTATNWDNGVPDNTTHAHIDQGVDALLGSGSADILDLEVGNNRVLTVNGGATLASGRIFLGDSNDGWMVIDGDGTVVHASSATLTDVSVGNSGTGFLNISDKALLTTSAGTDEFYLGNGSNATGNLSLLSGGALATRSIKKGHAGAATFDGGVFRALADTTDVFQNFNPGEFTLSGDGGTIDTNGFDITATNVIDGTGALQKIGAGTLILNGANTYSGNSLLFGGTLEAGASSAFGNVGVVHATATSGIPSAIKVDAGVVVNNTFVAMSAATVGNQLGTMTFDNWGTIHALPYGLTVGGYGTTTLYNHANASIAGDYFAVQVVNDGPTVNTIATKIINDGSISASGLSANGYGLGVVSGVANINNSHSGSIAGKLYGVYAVPQGSLLTNAGHISGGSGAASSKPFTIINNNGGSIEGTEVGIAFLTGGNVTNAAGATISASTGYPGILEYTKAALEGFLPPFVVEALRLAGYFGFGDLLPLPTFGGSITLSNAGSIIGDVVLDPDAANSVTLTAGGSIAGNLVVGTNTTSTLTLDGDNAIAQVYSAAVTGTTTFAGALTKAGSGTWVIDIDDLSGASGTSISAGVLQVDGNLGSIAVDAGVLGGIGTVTGIALNSGGAIAPGDSPGALHAASLNWSGGGSFDFQLGSTPVNSDLLALSGTLANSGGSGFTFHFADGSGTPIIGNTYTLITFASATGFTASDFSYDYTGGTAHFSGHFLLNPGSLQFVVDKLAQTISNFNATPANPVYSPGGSFGVSATGGASGQPLVFASTTPGVCTVTGSAVTMQSPGTCNLTADQTGDSNYAAAPQVTLSVTIGLASQSITFATPSSQLLQQHSITLNPVASSSLPVALVSDTPSVCSVAGSAPFTVTLTNIGTCTLTASQAGDTNYAAAAPASVSFAVQITNVSVPALDKRMLLLLGLLLGYAGFGWRRRDAKRLAKR